MTNERAKNDLAGIIDSAEEQLRTIARLQHERARLTASATVSGKRVTVTVNADNTVVETRFGPNIEDLSYSEIAKAVTEAAQQAAAELARRTQELFAPLQAQRARMPKLTDLVEGMPDLRLPEAPPVSNAGPNAPERQRDSGAGGFADAETFEHRNTRGGGITDSSW
ncbi:YbaB/EbfC family nucleoid-associated protein [Nocardia veterana]|uniref:YbaB/EbfC family nucleoid-associated protein n=1 Tax=Nocardia veterana TaxID=132249 RepID=A0A7X6M230_9NOCA|nr:YbaB/EbfC family nucleoid-associated protein [Nocardia veterana]NKY88772.1 YbaB/EbfC family nucleoid-associated protein [Nocardia veterana]